MKNQVIKYEGRTYLILSLHDVFDCYVAQEIGRAFKTLIPTDLITSEVA